MPHPVAETFARVARMLADDAAREGNCLHFGSGEEIIYVGDIHGHRANLAKVIRFADLAGRPHRRLVLQELIHGGTPDPSGGDRSVEVLLRAARLKLSFPDRVFFLLANHDVAQVAGQEITKDGRGMCKAFRAGLENNFGADAEEVCAAIGELLLAQPLAARCANGAFLSHSLPSPHRMELIDWDILRRPYRQEDLQRGGSLYEWTWGRGHTPEQLAELSGILGARLFLLGHQPVESGWEIRHGREIILASDHAHGAVMVFDAGAEMPDDRLAEHVRPIVALS